MSITAPPRDGFSPDPSQPVALADENALRSAFLAEYRALDEEARADLGSAAILSQKVVEGAFVRAWDARTKLHTAAELHEFLVDDVHHAAARALARRIAAHHRTSPPGGVAAQPDETTVVPADGAREIDPEQAWAHIQHALHGEHSARALSEAAAVSRHDAAQHIAGATRERDWRMLAVAAVVLVAALVALEWWVDRRSDDNRLARALGANDTRVVVAPAGRVGLVTLDDGSRVRLAPDSRLMIPATFGGRIRGVGLEGAAAFEVAPGQAREFRVRARDATVVATGTAFALRDYAADPAVTVAVTQGSVELHAANQSATLASGEARAVAPGSAPRAATVAERTAATNWAAGTFAVDDRPLGEVLPELHRWYGLDVGVPNRADLARRVTLRASLDSSGQVIRGIERSTGLVFGYAGRAMVLREGGAR